MDQVSDNSDGIISPDSTIEELCAYLVNLITTNNPGAVDIEEDIITALDSLEEAGQIDSTTQI